MFSAISFINRAKSDTIFDIEIDNELFNNCNADEAVMFIADYEAKMSALPEYGEWTAEVMSFFVSSSDPNTICLSVL